MQIPRDNWLPLEDTRITPEGRWESGARFGCSSEWLSGHFDECPVVPGVALLALAAEMVRGQGRVQGRLPGVSGFSRVRFKRLIFPGEELIHCLNESGAKVVVTLDLFAQNIYRVIQDTGVKRVILHSVIGLEKKIPLEEGAPPPQLFQEVLASVRSAEEPVAQISPGNVAALQYTSGSTGAPKAATLTHSNIVASVLQSETWMGIEGAGNAAVIGAPDRIKGQAIPAVIVLKEGRQGGKQEFLNYCKENAPDYRVPKTILLRDAIPKDPAGKILKRVLKQESQAV